MTFPVPKWSPGSEPLVQKPDTGSKIAVHRHVAAQDKAAGMDIWGQSLADRRPFDRERQIPGIANLDAASPGDPFPVA